jgi:hypothetical protein
MDVLVLFLLNVLLFIIFGLVLARRFERLYNSRTFLRKVEEEAHQIMTAFNQNSDEHLRILEDRIEKLTQLKTESDSLIKKLAWLKDEHIEARGVVEPPKTVYAPQVERRMPLGTENSGTLIVDRKQQVINLFQAGLSSESISQKTGIPLGEVELILRFMVQK